MLIYLKDPLTVIIPSVSEPLLLKDLGSMYIVSVYKVKHPSIYPAILHGNSNLLAEGKNHTIPFQSELYPSLSTQ